MQLLMKNRTRYYGRGFCGNVEMECIVKCALTSWAKYRPIGSHNKQFLHNFRFFGAGLPKTSGRFWPKAAFRLVRARMTATDPFSVIPFVPQLTIVLMKSNPGLQIDLARPACSHIPGWKPVLGSRPAIGAYWARPLQARLGLVGAHGRTDGHGIAKPHWHHPVRQDGDQ